MRGREEGREITKRSGLKRKLQSLASSVEQRCESPVAPSLLSPKCFLCLCVCVCWGRAGVGGQRSAVSRLEKSQTMMSAVTGFFFSPPFLSLTPFLLVFCPPVDEVPDPTRSALSSLCFSLLLFFLQPRPPPSLLNCLC